MSHNKRTRVLPCTHEDLLLFFFQLGRSRQKNTCGLLCKSAASSKPAGSFFSPQRKNNYNRAPVSKRACLSQCRRHINNNNKTNTIAATVTSSERRPSRRLLPHGGDAENHVRSCPAFTRPATHFLRHPCCRFVQRRDFHRSHLDWVSAASVATAGLTHQSQETLPANVSPPIIGCSFRPPKLPLAVRR